MIDVINFYKVSSLENTKKFYGEWLEFDLYKDQGKCLIYDVGFGKLGFCTHFPKEASGCITFVFEDRQKVDKYYNLLKEKCVLEVPSYNEFFKIYHFFATDLNGLKVEFQCFEEE